MICGKRQTVGCRDTSQFWVHIFYLWVWLLSLVFHNERIITFFLYVISKFSRMNKQALLLWRCDENNQNIILKASGSHLLPRLVWLWRVPMGSVLSCSWLREDVATSLPKLDELAQSARAQWEEPRTLEKETSSHG